MNFKVFETEHLKKAGLLTFTPSVSEWVKQTNVIGLFVKKKEYVNLDVIKQVGKGIRDFIEKRQ